MAEHVAAIDLIPDQVLISALLRYSYHVLFSFGIISCSHVSRLNFIREWNVSQF